MSEKLDFSTLRSREKFNDLKPEEKQDIINATLDEGSLININIGKDGVKDYQEAVQKISSIKHSYNYINSGGIDDFDILKFKSTLNLSDNDFERLALEKFKELFIYNGYNGGISKYEYARRCQEKLQISLEKVRDIAEKEFVRLVEDGQSFYAIDLKNVFDLPDSILNLPAVQDAAKKDFFIFLSRNNAKYATELANEFQLPNALLLSPEYQQVLNTHKNELLRLLEIMDMQSIIDYIGKIGETIEKLPEEAINQPELQNAALNGFDKALSKYSSSLDNIAEAKNIKDKFRLDDKQTKQIAEKVFSEMLIEGIVDYAIDIKTQFDLPEVQAMTAVTQAKVRQGIVNLLLGNHFNQFNDVNKLIQKLTLPSEIVQSSAKTALFDRLIDNDIDLAVEIQATFKVDVNYTELSNRFPTIHSLIEKLEAVATESKINFRDFDMFVQLITFKNEPEKFIEIINQNPFLISALAENKQHGSKLLVKFPELDNIAKQNISILYDNKAVIVKQNPNINSDSLEFRVLMQQHLAQYGRNEKILAEIARHGVNIKQWLKYSGEQYFDLGVEDDVSFSEQIQTPIKRIDQSIGNYVNQIVTTLGQYKKDLLLKESASDKEPELETKLAKMREQLIESERLGDEAKQQGIQKGVASLEKQIEQLKPGNLWDKISGEINRLKSSSEHLSKLFQELCSLEEELKTISDDKKLQIAQKGKIKKQEQNIKEKIIDFDKSLTGFQNNFNSMLEQAFSNDRAVAVSQEIIMAVGEDFDHYRTDLSTIQSLFKEDASSLEKTPMRIGIAPRNPDVDLYLGNYAPCCICINSEYHGEQSPIADYITDLGMHNIVVYDEQRKKPVAVAWCFIGQNKKSAEPVLVIDNIEANTDYSIKFKSQLEKELGNYTTKFAEASRINKVIQGQFNNDLEVAELSEIDYKLGGTNRATGYYLEAERNDGENDAEDWEEDYYEDEVDSAIVEQTNEILPENTEQNEKYSEYENERGDFLRSNRARKAIRENK